MSPRAEVIEPNPAEAEFHARKYRVFKLMYEHQLEPMDLNIGRELTMARGLTRGKRKLSVTPLRCRDRRLVHRPYGADSLGG